jgi:hypothetical protein
MIFLRPRGAADAMSGPASVEAVIRQEGVALRVSLHQRMEVWTAMFATGHSTRKGIRKRKARGDLTCLFGFHSASQLHQMSLKRGLPTINMKAEHMVPDETTEGHNPRYWCLPPVHYEPDAVSAVGGGYKYHLVTRGREVGVWKDW